MRVNQLIEVLQTLPAELFVMIEDNDGDKYHVVSAALSNDNGFPRVMLEVLIDK